MQVLISYLRVFPALLSRFLNEIMYNVHNTQDKY